MVIPEEYVLEENNTQPANTVIRYCKFCSRKFAIPEELDKECKPTTHVCSNPKCKEESNKEYAKIVQLLMKSPSEANDLIKKALGN